MIQKTTIRKTCLRASSLAAVFALSFMGCRAALAQSSPQAAPQAKAPAARTPLTGDVFVSAQGSDSGNGSQQHPWATITHASQMIGPGATVHVAPGNYNEIVETKVSGAPSARIKYVSERRWEAVIAPTAAEGLFTWNDTGDYTDIVNFQIAGNLCTGIALGGSYQRAVGNNVHNAASDCNNSHGGSGIASYNVEKQDNEILGNYVHDVGGADPLCGQPGHRTVQGIYQSNAGGRISNNIVARVCVVGIHLWHAATHATITNNTVVFNRGGGILNGSGDSPCNVKSCINDYTIVRNNIVAFNGNPILKGWGISEGGGAGGKMGTHNQYSNNLSYQNPSGDFAFENHLTCQNCITGKDPRLGHPQGDDFHLEGASPAIGHGTSSDAPATDYEGKQRKSADIGAAAAGSE